MYYWYYIYIYIYNIDNSQLNNKKTTQLKKMGEKSEQTFLQRYINGQ